MNSQIEEIQKLYIKEKVYKIPKKPKQGQAQADILITPLSMDELELMDMDKDASITETAKNIEKLMARSLNVDAEVVKNLSIEFMQELMASIMDANNCDDNQGKGSKFDEFMDNKRSLVAKETKPNESK